MKRKNIFVIFAVTLLILMIPFVAMQFTDFFSLGNKNDNSLSYQAETKTSNETSTQQLSVTEKDSKSAIVYDKKNENSSLIVSEKDQSTAVIYSPSDTSGSIDIDYGAVNLDDLHTYVNTSRKSAGFKELKSNTSLDKSAELKCNDMVALDYWAHNAPDGSEPWVFFNLVEYSYSKAGENLAYGFSSAKSTVKGWENSPTHKANMHDPAFTDVGYSMCESPNFVGDGKMKIVVQHLAKQ